MQKRYIYFSRKTICLRLNFVDQTRFKDKTRSFDEPDLQGWKPTQALGV